MNSLDARPVVDTLNRLHADADRTDGEFMAALTGQAESGVDLLAVALQAEAQDYREFYRRTANNFLSVSRTYGRFLYVCARITNARRAVEFGTSFGVSTIYLACAVRDNGGGVVIGTELEASKAQRARENLAAAGLTDGTDVRTGDALDVLSADLGGTVDFVHLDGALSLYGPVLRLLEPRLRPGALVLAENATPDYVALADDPASQFVSIPLPFDEGRGNHLSVFTGNPQADGHDPRR